MEVGNGYLKYLIYITSSVTKVPGSSFFDRHLSQMQNSVPAECTTVVLRDEINWSARHARSEYPESFLVPTSPT